MTPRARDLGHASVGGHLGRIVLVSAVVAALAGCAGSGGTLPTVTGNEQGGKVPYAEGSMPAAMDAAKAHCSQFNKKAQMTQMSPAAEGGGTVGFQCR